MEFDSFSISDLHHRISSPTCEDLGIPRDLGRDLVVAGRAGLETPSTIGRLFRPAGGATPGAPGGSTQSEVANFESQVLTIDGLKYEMENPNNPFSPFCQIPVPNPYSNYECGFEPAFIRKRNERERERVRGVNDGYQRLRNHLPLLESKEKRISKVETLRSAIRYIRHLQTLLAELDRAPVKEAGDRKSDVSPVNTKAADVDKTQKIKYNKEVSEHKSKRKALERDD